MESQEGANGYSDIRGQVEFRMVAMLRLNYYGQGQKSRIIAKTKTLKTCDIIESDNFPLS